MDKKEKVLLELELNEKGFMRMERNKFENSISYDDRVVAIFGKGGDMDIFVIGKEKMDAMGLTYKDCLDDIPHEELKFYNQRIPKDEFEINAQHNMDLLEKHALKVRNESTVKLRDTGKAKRSVNGLR